MVSSSSRRALLSVYDKSDLVPTGKRLVALGYEIVASGGTARALKAAGVEVRPVEAITGFPEMLGGRVKTLHPAVHGGLLAMRTPEHLRELERQGIAPIDVVICNLYPFEATIAKPGVTLADAIEQIDIGGVTLLRAAAKNHESVLVLSNPKDYDEALEALEAGRDPAGLRRRLALAAFRATAAYDAAISGWLAKLESDADERTDADLPAAINVGLLRTQTLRYGQNPHQKAALYEWRDRAPAFEQIGGEKALSYNNLLDLAAAWAVPGEFEDPACAIIKHTTPCGVATADDLVTAFRRALACDPASAFGSLIAVNRPIDAAFVEAIGKLFVEVIIAPSFDDAARERLGRRKKNCRLIRPNPDGAIDGFELRSVPGGMVAQTHDQFTPDELDPAAWTVVSDRAPTADERVALAFAWRVVKHVKSNAIVLARGTTTVGIGGGETNRAGAVRLAAKRAGDNGRGAVVASDAFFPFADGLETAAAAGVTALIQPGGSIRDEEVIEAANRLRLAMVHTDRRHFRH